MSPQKIEVHSDGKVIEDKQNKVRQNSSESTIVVKKITNAAICQIREELEQLEVQAKLELKDPRTSAVDVLRMDLIEECRRRLLFITTALFEGRREPYGRNPASVDEAFIEPREVRHDYAV
jgi:hypothetical protein